MNFKSKEVYINQLGIGLLTSTSSGPTSYFINDVCLCIYIEYFRHQMPKFSIYIIYITLKNLDYWETKKWGSNSGKGGVRR